MRFVALVVAVLMVLAWAYPSSSAAAWGPGIEAALPANSSTSPSVDLTSVSCPSAGDCSAVGSYLDSADHQHAFFLDEASRAWATGVEAALPSNAGSNPGASLASVSCPSAGDCSAVGSYYDGSGNAGLLLDETSGMWSTGLEASLPMNTGTDPGVNLTSVSCASPGNCSAVGNYVDSSGKTQGLLLDEASGTWSTGGEVALPSNAASNPNVGLTSVSCATPGNCSAVGTYVDSSGNVQGLLLDESAGTWSTGMEAAVPSGGAGVPVGLTSVSCATPGNCSAVGSYYASTGQDGLLLDESSGAWSPGVGAGLPANAICRVNCVTSAPAGLASVSCAAPGNCSAVGYYSATSGQQGLLLDERSGTWSAGVEAAMPANANPSPSASLTSVSCPSAGNCTAVGDYFVGSGYTDLAGLLLDENSGTWSTGVEAALPANAGSTPGVYLASVSCAPARNCGAVGDYADSASATQGLLVSEAPMLTVAVAGSGSGAVTGSGISCPGTCSGTYSSGTAITLTASSSAGSTFDGWSGGGCSGTGPCQFTIEGDISVTATFSASGEGGGGGGAPQVQTLPATDVTVTGVTLQGSLNPNGVAVADCHFDLGTTTSYGQTVGCDPSYVGSGTSPVAISAAIGVDPGTTYHYRLVATNANGTATGQDLTFTTGTCGTGTPTICSVLPDNGPVLGGTQIFVQGTGFRSGDQLCFYAAPGFQPVACASRSQTTVYNSTSMQTVTPSLGNSAAVGQYYLGIERCCTYQGTNILHTDYVSNTTYLYYPPPPLVSPGCDIFSIGPNACWRVGLGAVVSGLFHPGRPPDYLILGLGGGPEVLSVNGTVVLTCSGDLWAAGGASVGPSLSPVQLMFGYGYVGLPTDGPGSRSWGDADGFVSGLTGEFTLEAGLSTGVILSPFAPGPRWGVEWFGATNLSAAAGFSFSQYLLGADPYSRGTSPQPLNSTANGYDCLDVFSSSTWQAMQQAANGVLGVSGNTAVVALPCLSGGGCSGTASISAGNVAGTAGITRVRFASRQTLLGKKRFSILARTVRRVQVRLNSTAARLLAAGHGRLRARLTLNETIGGRAYHHTAIVTLGLPPGLTDVKQSTAKWREAGGTASRVRTIFSFKLNESATVALIFSERVHGQTLNVGERLVGGHRGSNVIPFRGVLSHNNKLLPGKYTVKVVAADTAGQRSVPHRLTFTVLR